MGGFSLFHWIVLLVVVAIPVVLVLILRRDARPDDSNLEVTNYQMNWKQLYFGIKGRIGCKQYWLSAIAWMVPVFVFVLIAKLIGDPSVSVPQWLQIVLGCLTTVVFVAYVWSGICLYAKRWHDRNKSGWWQLIGIVPIIGELWALAQTGFLRGTAGPNRFGPDPLM